MSTTVKVKIDCRIVKYPWLVEMSAGENPVFSFARVGWEGRRERDQRFREWDQLTKKEKDAFRRNLDRVRDQKTKETIEWDRATVEGKSDAKPPSHLIILTHVDPWIMRKQFFNIKEPDDALAFFRQFGLWRYRRGPEDEAEMRFPLEPAMDAQGEPLPITFSELMYQRKFFEGALSKGPRETARLIEAASATKSDPDLTSFWAKYQRAYLFGGIESEGTIAGLAITLQLTQEMAYPGPYSAQLPCHDIQDALRASLLLDWMEGREWPRCQNKKCNNLFKRTSKHPMFYCGSKCSARVRQKRFQAELKLKSHPPTKSKGGK